MKKTTITCDHCGKEIVGYDYRNHIEFTLSYWHGGSIGGSEDEDNFTLDLCGDCAQELSYILREWNKKGTH